MLASILALGVLGGCGAGSDEAPASATSTPEEVTPVSYGARGPFGVRPESSSAAASGAAPSPVTNVSSGDSASGSGGVDDDGAGAAAGDDGAGAAGDGAAADPASGAAAAESVTFTAQIHDILVDNCGRCHGSGSLPRFAATSESASYSTAVRLQNQILGEIVAGEMPADSCDGAPGSPGCVSVADLTLIRQWIAGGAPE